MRERILNKVFRKLRQAAIPLASLSSGYMLFKPEMIGIEPTNRCNLDCVMCVRRYWDKDANPLGDMPLELFTEKILPFLDFTQHIQLQCLGEPLLGGHFFEMLDACKKKGCVVAFITNGLYLREYADRIVGSGVDGITVSIDGIKALPKIRGITIDALRDGICAINDARRRLGRELPTISVNFVLMKENVSELPDMIGLAAELEIRKLTVIHPVIHSEALLGQSMLNDVVTAQRYFDITRKEAGRLGIELILPGLETAIARCGQPFDTLYINWNGDVRPCCAATLNEKDTLKLGNLKNDTLPRLWNCPEMRSLRMALLKEKGMPRFCEMCSMRSCSLESHTRLMR